MKLKREKLFIGIFFPIILLVNSFNVQAKSVCSKTTEADFSPNIIATLETLDLSKIKDNEYRIRLAAKLGAWKFYKLNDTPFEKCHVISLSKYGFKDVFAYPVVNKQYGSKQIYLPLKGAYRARIEPSKIKDVIKRHDFVTISTLVEKTGLVEIEFFDKIDWDEKAEEIKKDFDIKDLENIFPRIYRIM